MKTWKASRRWNVALQSLFKRGRQCLLNRPASRKASVQSGYANSDFGCPVGKTERFSVECDVPNKRRSIARLFLGCCPTAVFRGISLRSIDPIDTMGCGWFLSHVGVEVLKGFPSLAYCHVVSAVVRKIFRVRVIAAVIHSLPCDVFWRGAHAVLAFAARLASIASTTSKRRATNCLASSAFALADPVYRFRWMIDCLLDHSPFAESLPSQVFEARVPTSRIGFSHDFVPQKQVVVRTASQLQLIGCSHFSTSDMRSAS